MQRQVPEYLAIFLAVIIGGPAVWADEKPKVAKADNEVQRQTPELMQVSENPKVAKADTSDVKKEESSEATAGEITVSWKGGQLTFPETSSKESGLKLRCTGNVMIEGKGFTAKGNQLDLTIAGNGVIPKASDVSFRCAGSVMIEWKGFTAMAADLQYNAEKDVLLLSSGGKANGCVLRSKNKDGTNSVLIADQISLSPSSSKVSCVGVKEYRAVDASTPTTIPAGSFAPGPAVGPATTYYVPPGAYRFPTPDPAPTYPAPGPAN